MTALQPLTDTQVQNRLVAYNPDGALERDLHGLWEDAREIIRECARANFGDGAVAVVERHYTKKVDAAWVQNVADFGQRLYREKQSVPQYIATRDKLICDIITRLFEKIRRRPGETMQACHFAAAPHQLRDRHHPCSGRAA